MNTALTVWFLSERKIGGPWTLRSETQDRSNVVLATNPRRCSNWLNENVVHVMVWLTRNMIHRVRLNIVLSSLAVPITTVAAIDVSEAQLQMAPARERMAVLHERNDLILLSANWLTQKYWPPEWGNADASSARLISQHKPTNDMITNPYRNAGSPPNGSTHTPHWLTVTVYLKFCSSYDFKHVNLLN